MFRASTTLALDSHRSNYYLSTRIEFESGTYSESFMPRFDLRQDDGTLHPLASFKVLAVMLHPSNLVLREKMLGTTEKETGGLRPRRQPATAEMFIKSISSSLRLFWSRALYRSTDLEPPHLSQGPQDRSTSVATQSSPEVDGPRRPCSPRLR